MDFRFNRFAPDRVVELTAERRANLRQHGRAHREPARPYVDGIGFELLVEAFGVELDQHLIERHAGRPRCLIVSR